MAEALTCGQGIWDRNTELLLLHHPAELRAGLWQRICPLGWVTECQVKMPEGESAAGLSNICSSPTKFFLLQSLKVLHCSREGTGTHERGLLGDVCQLP